MVQAVWKRELQPKLFRISHHKPEQFYLCQWQQTGQVNMFYLIYRWMFAFLFLTILVTALSGAGRTEQTVEYTFKWFIYLTNWGFTLCTIQAYLSAGILTQQCLKEKKTDCPSPVESLPVLYKIFWVIHTISMVAAICITITYWAAVFDPTRHRIDALNILLHATNSLFMLIDFFLVCHPFRLLHCYLPFIFALVYVTFTGIYYAAGGTDREGFIYIYPILNWSKPGQTVIVIALGAIFVIFIHFLIWLLFILRRKIAKATSIKKDNFTSKNISSESMQTSLAMSTIS